eukprot:4332117-Pleurochrysis_carterae.AAC.1
MFAPSHRFAIVAEVAFSLCTHWASTGRKAPVPVSSSGERRRCFALVDVSDDSNQPRRGSRTVPSRARTPSASARRKLANSYNAAVK